MIRHYITELKHLSDITSGGTGPWLVEHLFMHASADEPVNLLEVLSSPSVNVVAASGFYEATHQSASMMMRVWVPTLGDYQETQAVYHTSVLLMRAELMRYIKYPEYLGNINLDITFKKWYSWILTLFGRWDIIRYHNRTTNYTNNQLIAGLIIGLRPANERRRYFVTTSLVDWAQT